MRLLATVSSIAVLLTIPAWAQEGNPAGMSPGTPQAAPGVPAPNQPNQPDRLFVHEATIGGMAEVELGKLAEQKGHNDAVKDFARRMVEDHTKANDRLMSLAKQDGVVLPDVLDREHRTMRTELEKSSGAEFDRAYIQGQVQDHQKAAQLLEWEIGSGQDTQLKSFAAETLPVVLQHLQMARNLQAQMTGKVP
jgi:putative membrane protein